MMDEVRWHVEMSRGILKDDMDFTRHSDQVNGAKERCVAKEERRDGGEGGRGEDAEDSNRKFKK